MAWVLDHEGGHAKRTYSCALESLTRMLQLQLAQAQGRTRMSSGRGRCDVLHPICYGKSLVLKRHFFCAIFKEAGHRLAIPRAC